MRTVTGTVRGTVHAAVEGTEPFFTTTDLSHTRPHQHQHLKNDGAGSHSSTGCTSAREPDMTTTEPIECDDCGHYDLAHNSQDGCTGLTSHFEAIAWGMGLAMKTEQCDCESFTPKPLSVSEER